MAPKPAYHSNSEEEETFQKQFLKTVFICLRFFANPFEIANLKSEIVMNMC